MTTKRRRIVDENLSGIFSMIREVSDETKGGGGEDEIIANMMIAGREPDGNLRWRSNAVVFKGLGNFVEILKVEGARDSSHSTGSLVTALYLLVLKSRCKT